MNFAGFKEGVGVAKDMVAIPSGIAATVGAGMLLKMNAEGKKSGNNNKSVTITALPGSTVILPPDNGAKNMNKIAAEEACCNAAFADELGKITAGTPVNDNAQASADVEERREQLNGRQGVLGQGGVSHATARSVAVNQPAPAQS